MSEIKLQVGDVVELESGDKVMITSYHKESDRYFSGHLNWNSCGASSINPVVSIVGTAMYIEIER